MLTRASREALGLFISCLGGASILFVVSPRLLIGTLGWLLLGGAVLGAILTIITDMRRGANPLRSFIGVVVVGAILIGSVYGLTAYFASLLTSGQPLM